MFIVFFLTKEFNLFSMNLGEDVINMLGLFLAAFVFFSFGFSISYYLMDGCYSFMMLICFRGKRTPFCFSILDRSPTVMPDTGLD